MNTKWRFIMKKLALAALVLGSTVALTGCFDKDEAVQKVA